MFIITIYTLCLIVNLTSVDGKRGCEFKYWPANAKFYHLLMLFENSLDPDQA